MMLGRTGAGRRGRVRTPTVLQMEAVECGAACLAMVLAYYGRWVPLEELRVVCGVSRDGAKASKVVQAARHYGLEAKGLKLELEQVRQQPLPFIAFWGFNHFVVVEGFSAAGVFINDPASGPRRVSAKEFSESFTGVALTMAPGPGFQKGGRRPSLLGALLPRLKGSRAAVGYVVAASLLLILPGIVLPAALKTFVDDVLVRGFNGWILPLLVGLLLATLVNGGLTWLQQRALLRLQTKLGIATAGEFFWHVLRVPVVFYTQRYVGDVAQRVQSCHRLAAILAGPLPTTVVHCFTAVFFAGVMLVYSVELTLVTTALTLLNFLVLRSVQRRRQDLNAVALNQGAQLAGASMVGLQAIETLKSTGTENDFFQTWAGYQTNTVNTNQRMGAISTALSLGPTLIGTMTSAAVLGVGALLIMDGRLTIGGLVAFQALMANFTGPIDNLVGFAGQTQEIRGDLARLDDVLRYPRDPALAADDLAGGGEPGLVGPDAAKLSDTKLSGTKLSGALELRGVSFAYNPLDPPLIEDFSLKVAPGQRIALVGGSGSGKSTLARLLLGLYPPTGGEILYDGRPISAIPRSVFTGSAASVDQDIFMFEGTIADNLTLWDPTIQREQMLLAAKDACIHEAIAARPGGYDGVMAEGGANFSGGQRQRLEIARALVRRPSLLILDEATSALDPETERVIDDNLRRRGCTCVIVAHRLSTVRDCDEIIVLDGGKVVERGTHDSLIAAKGRYAQLVSMQ